METRTVDGVTYLAQRDLKNSCKGCVASRNSDLLLNSKEMEERRHLCFALPNCDDKIFVRKLDTVIYVDTKGVASDKLDPVPVTVDKAPERNLPVTFEQAKTNAYHDGYRAGYAACEADHITGTREGKPEGTLYQPLTKRTFPQIATSMAMGAAYGLARSTDPATSKAAASGMTPRKAGKIADLILVELGAQPGTVRLCLTGKQLAERTGVPLNSITPRFAQLSRKGLIYAYSGAGRETVWALGNGVAA